MTNSTEYAAYAKYVEGIQKKQRNLNLYGQLGGHRDSEMQKTYNAEFEFQRMDCGHERMSQEDARKFFAKVMRSKKITTIFRAGYRVTPKTMTLSFFESRRWAGRAMLNRVEMNTLFGVDKYSMLHEIVHGCGWDNHGVMFRKHLISLVSCFMGWDAGQALKKTFKSHGLRVAPPPLNIKTFDQWVKTYRSLQAARSARS